jgi:hypothetical protein
MYSGYYNICSLRTLVGLYGGKIPHGEGFMHKNGVDDSAHPLFASSDDPFLFHNCRSNPVQSNFLIRILVMKPKCGSKTTTRLLISSIVSIHQFN